MAVPNNSKAEKQLTLQEKLDAVTKEKTEKFDDTITGKNNKATTDLQGDLDKVGKDKDADKTATKDGAEKGTEEPSKPKVYIHTDLVAVEPNIMD